MGKKKALVKKRKKRTPLAIIKDKLWDLCKVYIRKRYPNNCYTCDAKNIVGVNCQTGHFIPSVLCPFILNYHPMNLRLQCMRCNKWAGGNGSQFYLNLVNAHGQGYVDDLFEMKKQPRTKLTIKDYEEYIDLYKQLIKELP